MGKLYDKYGNHIGCIGEFSGSKGKTYDEYGNHTGYVEQSGGSRDRILDEYGNHTGYIERSGGSRDRILDEYGNHTGYIERSGGSRDRILDEYGNHTGYSGSDRSTSQSYGSGSGQGGCLTWLISVVSIVLVCVIGFNILLNRVENGLRVENEPKEDSVSDSIVAAPILNTNQECGQGVWYTLDDYGNMTIFGSGEIENYTLNENSGFKYPWDDFRDSLKSLYIEEGVIGEIPKVAFSYCENLTSVAIAGDIDGIGDGAFFNCTSLVSVILPDGVTTIGNSSFADCISLTNIELPNSVKTIGSLSFNRCESLETIDLGSSVECISYLAFLDCKSLRSIRIPQTLQCIGSANAFQGTSITDIYYEGSKSEWNRIEFDKSASILTGYVDEFTGMGITIHYEHTIESNAGGSANSVGTKHDCVEHDWGASYFNDDGAVTKYTCSICKVVIDA